MIPRKALFYLHILGDPVLLGPDWPVVGRSAYKRRIALLAVLALARGRPVGRERLIGLLWPVISKLGLGRLPGDIVIRRDHVTFYAPIVTCLLVSLILSLIVWIFGR